MTKPIYQRTTRSRNKLNRRCYRPLEPVPGYLIDAVGRNYVVAADGAIVRVRKQEGKR